MTVASAVPPPDRVRTGPGTLPAEAVGASRGPPHRPGTVFDHSLPSVPSHRSEATDPAPAGCRARAHARMDCAGTGTDARRVVVRCLFRGLGTNAGSRLRATLERMSARFTLTGTEGVSRSVLHSQHHVAPYTLKRPAHPPPLYACISTDRHMQPEPGGPSGRAPRCSDKTPDVRHAALPWPDNPVLPSVALPRDSESIPPQRLSRAGAARLLA